MMSVLVTEVQIQPPNLFLQANHLLRSQVLQNTMCEKELNWAIQIICQLANRK